MISPVMSGDRVSSHASRVASGCALAVMALGLVVMAGWLLGIESIKRVLPGLASMKFNTALGFLLAGGALFFRGKTTLRGGLAAAVGLLGALTLGEYLSGIDFGIDQILFRVEGEAGQAAGRMSQATALCFLLGGAALALLGKPHRDGGSWAEVLAIGMGTIGLIAVLGYALDAQDLYRIPGFSSMALHTSVGFIVLAAGILSAVPEGIVGRLLHGTDRLLWLGFGVLTALLIFLGVVSVSQLRSIAAKVDAQAEVARPRAEATLALEANVVSYGLNVAIFLVGDAGARLLAEGDAVDVAQSLADYERLAETLLQQDLAARFRAQWLELHAYGEALMAAGVHDPEGLVRLATLRRALEAFLENEIQPEAVAAFEARRTATQATLQYTEDIMLLLLVCGVVLALVTSGAVIRAVLGGEAALRVSEERWRYALEISELGAWELDLANHKAWRSLRYDQIFGYQELLPDWSYEVFLRQVLEEDRAEVDRSFQNALAEQEPWNFECRIHRADGAVRWIWAYGKNILDAEGQGGRMFGLVSDITKRKQADESLRESAERFRTLFESLPIGAVIIDQDTLGFVIFNRATAENLGYAPEEFALLRLPEVEAVHDEALIRANTQRIAAGEAMNFESKHRTKSGELRDMLIHGRRFEMGGRGLVLAIFMDITERKQVDRAVRQLNEELELRVGERTADLMAANKELEAFSYSVSHDLRAPLRAVDGFSQLMLTDYGAKLDDEGRRMLGVIRSEAQRMGRLIDDLLAFSRLGRQPIESARIDMREMAQEVFKELIAAEPKRQVRLDLHPLPPALGTATMIRQLWVNLIGNAIKFTTGRKIAQIEIGVKEGGNGERIYYIKDNGVGFDMRYVDKLFGVFQRLHSQQEFPGTGVGLALVQRIVQRHGGRVWAEAELNRGATFYFTLTRRS
jgi:PAS domain S-box-containing protein